MCVTWGNESKQQGPVYRTNENKWWSRREAKVLQSDSFVSVASVTLSSKSLSLSFFLFTTCFSYDLTSSWDLCLARLSSCRRLWGIDLHLFHLTRLRFARLTWIRSSVKLPYIQNPWFLRLESPPPQIKNRYLIDAAFAWALLHPRYDCNSIYLSRMHFFFFFEY